jgi:phosphate:Na+ symporter
MEEELFDFWKFLAGIGIFLWGMHQLETALKEMAGKSFQLMLQKSTNTRIKGILSGAFITAVLQSSSLVTLLVLAFLGAGLIGLKNAVGVVFGANLGTTLTAWIIASIGFKLSIAAFSMPFLAVGSLFHLFFAKRPFLKNIGGFSLGFGFIFLGLEFMKTAIEAIAQQIDLQQFQAFGLCFFLLIGIIITALIQSSSAMMVIILSAMSSGIINLSEGAVMIIGANIGTTITVSIGAFQGTADKKRLALAHFLFNVVTGLLVFIFIDQLIAITLQGFAVKDPLIELVLLNTIFNMIGIFIFFPFIKPLVSWLEGLFVQKESSEPTLYIEEVSPNVPAAAIAALEKDIHFTLHATLGFIGRLWENSSIQSQNFRLWKKIMYQPENLLELYEQIKKQEDKLTNYHISVQENAKIDEKEAQKLTALMISLRSIIYAAKDMKDIMHNVKDLQDREDQKVYRFYIQLKNYVFEFLDHIKRAEENVHDKGQLFHLLHENKSLYERLIADVYANDFTQNDQFSSSTLTNMIRQSVSSLDHIVHSLLHSSQQVPAIKVVEENNGYESTEIYE